MPSCGPTRDGIESIHNKQNERKNMGNCTVHINDRNWTRVNVFCPTARKRPEIVNFAKEDIQVQTIWLFYETVDIYDSVGE